MSARFWSKADICLPPKADIQLFDHLVVARSDVLRHMVQGAIRCQILKHAQRGTIFCNARAVASSAGKNDSIASSDSVTSTGVPNTVVVLKNDSVPASVTSCNGTTTPPSVSGAGGARLCGAGYPRNSFIKVSSSGSAVISI